MDDGGGTAAGPATQRALFDNIAGLCFIVVCATFYVLLLFYYCECVYSCNRVTRCTQCILDLLLLHINHNVNCKPFKNICTCIY